MGRGRPGVHRPRRQRASSPAVSPKGAEVQGPRCHRQGAGYSQLPHLGLGHSLPNTRLKHMVGESQNMGEDGVWKGTWPREVRGWCWGGTSALGSGFLAEEEFGMREHSCRLPAPSLILQTKRGSEWQLRALVLASGLGAANLIKGCNPRGFPPFLPTVPRPLARQQSWSGGSGLKTHGFPGGRGLG